MIASRYIYMPGNVGIGTAAPTQTLDVNGISMEEAAAGRVPGVVSLPGAICGMADVHSERSVMIWVRARAGFRHDGPSVRSATSRP